MVTIFEFAILAISLASWKYTHLTLFPSHLLPSILIGLFIGEFVFLLSTIVFSRVKSKAIRRFVFEFHYRYVGKRRWVNFLLAPVVIAVSEETFFRGLLLPSIGFLLSNLLFSFVHMIRFSDKIVSFISIFIYGTFFSIAYYMTGSLLAPLLAHYVFSLLRIYYFETTIEQNPSTLVSAKVTQVLRKRNKKLLKLR